MSVLSEEELSEVVEVVWMTVLELPVTPGSEADLLASDYVMTSITISGAWDGVVRVRASEQFLTCAASHMFSINEEDVEQQDRVDTLTELTNMLGGTVKCLLPEICDLSLPEINSCSDDVEVDHDWIYFSCADYPLAVAVDGEVATVEADEAA